VTPSMKLLRAIESRMALIRRSRMHEPASLGSAGPGAATFTNWLETEPAREYLSLAQ
jgi:hypothetical protein